MERELPALGRGAGPPRRRGPLLALRRLLLLRGRGAGRRQGPERGLPRSPPGAGLSFPAAAQLRGGKRLGCSPGTFLGADTNAACGLRLLSSEL